MPRLICTVPEGERGKWKVERFTVSQDNARLGFLLGLGHGGRFAPEGEYTRLVYDGRWTMMSDTPDELRDFALFVEKAHGSVLVNGLGLGCVVQALLAKPEVADVTVIEKEEDVIALVEPHYRCDRLTVIRYCAFAWEPPKGRRWEGVWHDLWLEMSADNLPAMAKLHRKYARRCGFQMSWGREEALRQRRDGSGRWSLTRRST